MQQEVFKIQWYLRELELSKNWSGDKFFKIRKSKFWKRQSKPKTSKNCQVLWKPKPLFLALLWCSIQIEKPWTTFSSFFSSNVLTVDNNVSTFFIFALACTLPQVSRNDLYKQKKCLQKVQVSLKRWRILCFLKELKIKRSWLFLHLKCLA